MYIFFLFINLAISFIFYIFSGFIESVIFFIMWIVLFIYFSPFRVSKEKSNTKKTNLLEKFNINKNFFLKIVIPNIQKATYIIAFLFFYLSLYWISYSFSGDLFSIFTLIISLTLIILFFYTLKQNNKVIFLIFRSNFIVYSMLYLVFYIHYFFVWNEINYIFVINSLLSIFWIICLLFFDKAYLFFRRNLLYIYSLFYLFVFILFYLSYLFKIEFYILFTYLWMILSIIYFEYLPKIKELKIFDYTSKYFSIILNYTILLYSMILLFNLNYISEVLLILFIGILFNIYIHFKFENYLSFSFVIATIILFYIKFFIGLDIKDFISYIIFIFSLPFIFIFYTYLVKIKFINDNYFIHYSGLLFSLATILFYLFKFQDFDILHISILFLIESMLFLASFVKLKKW